MERGSLKVTQPTGHRRRTRLQDRGGSLAGWLDKDRSRLESQRPCSPTSPSFCFVICVDKRFHLLTGTWWGSSGVMQTCNLLHPAPGARSRSVTVLT